MPSDTENQGLELKRQVDNFREISKSICAFANAFGGRILVGVNNDGSTHGVPEAQLDSLQQRLEGAIQQVSPMPFHKIMVQEKDGKKIIAVEVYPVGQGSFCTFSGIVYYRAGSKDVKLEGRTLQDFMVKRRILSFDESISRASVSDMDAGKLRDFLKKRSPSVEFDEAKIGEYLLNMGLAVKNADLHILNAANLFFAREPARFLPQNEVKLVRFKGTEAVDILDSRMASSTIIENLKEAEDFIRKNTRTAYRIERLERVEAPEYPTVVVREALVNALVHRDYFSRDAIQINIFEDRIEFINPGTLPNGLSLQILGTLSVQRNPLTYRLMRELKLVEGLATGIPRMRGAMKAARLPEPRFEELGSFFRVTLYNKKPVERGEINERQKRALAYLSKNPSITSKTYMKLNSVSHPIAVLDLNKLGNLGKIKRIGKTRGTYYIAIK